MRFFRAFLILLVLTGVGAHAAPGPQGGKDRVDLYGDPLPPGTVARLGTTRYRHGGFGIAGFAFMPDGKTIVTAPLYQRTVQFWEARTGKLLRELSTGDLGIRCFALSPEGKFFAGGGFLSDSQRQPWPEEIRIWDTSSGKEQRKFERKDFDLDFCTLLFSPDSKLLFSLGRSGLLRIEEITTGVEILNHQFPRDVGMVLSPDGSTLAVSARNNAGKLFFWKWKTGEEPREFRVPGRGGSSLTFSPDGNQLVETDDYRQTLNIRAVATGRVLHQFSPSQSDDERINSALFLPDGKTLVASSYRKRHSGAIYFWDTSTDRLSRTIQTPDSSVGQLTLSADSKWLAGVSGYDLRIWDLTSNKGLRADIVAHQGEIAEILTTRDGRIVTASEDCTIRIWNAESGKQLLSINHEDWVRAIALSPDGNKLVSSSLDDTVGLWDLETGRRIYKLAGHGGSGVRRSVGFAPDGKSLFSWGDDMYLRKWDVVTGKAVFEHKLRPQGVRVLDDDDPNRLEFLGLREGVFTRDGKHFILNAGRSNHVFETATGNVVQTFPTEGNYLVSLTGSVDSKLLLTNEYAQHVPTKQPDGSVRQERPPNHPLTVREVSSGKVVLHLDLPGEDAGPAAFSPDGKLIAAAENKEGSPIRVLDTGNGEEVGVIKGFHGYVRALAFTADSKRLVTGMSDASALVWDLAEAVVKEK